MNIETVAAPGVFNAPAYAQAVKVSGIGSLVFLAGQVALDEKGEPTHLGDFKAQARAVLDAVKRLVEASGSSVDRIVKLTVFLTDARYRPDPRRLLRRQGAAPRGDRGRSVDAARVADRSRGDRRRLNASAR